MTSEDRNKQTFDDAIEIISLMKRLYGLAHENTIQLNRGWIFELLVNEWERHWKWCMELLMRKIP